MDLEQRGNEPLVRYNIPQPPAGHGVGLGKAADYNGPLPHTGQGGHRDKLRPVVDQPAVHLVGKDKQVMLRRQPGHRLQILPGIDGSAGVVGVIENNHLGSGGDPGLDGPGVQPEALPGGQGDLHHRGPGELHQILVGDKGRRGDNHLVALAHKGMDGIVQRLGPAGGDNNFRLRVVGRAGGPLHHSGDDGPQAGQSPVGGVVGVVLLNGPLGGGLDGAGGVEIGLAGAEGDYLVPLAPEGGRPVQNGADQGGLQPPGALGYHVSHTGPASSFTSLRHWPVVRYSRRLASVTSIML